MLTQAGAGLTRTALLPGSVRSACTKQCKPAACQSRTVARICCALTPTGARAWQAAGVWRCPLLGNPSEARTSSARATRACRAQGCWTSPQQVQPILDPTAWLPFGTGAAQHRARAAAATLTHELSLRVHGHALRHKVAGAPLCGEGLGAKQGRESRSWLPAWHANVQASAMNS